MKKHKLLILGTRGIPGNHDGFETFAERLALYLARREWKVTVYCQSNEAKLSYSIWQGVNLVHIPVPKDNSLWSTLFYLRATSHAMQQEGLILTLGYNAAVCSLLHYAKKRVNITSLYGFKWWSKKWNALEKSWLYINELSAVWFSKCLIVDHPHTKDYLRSEVKTYKPITVIPHTTQVVEKADEALLKDYNLVPQKYTLVIARPEPENSILEIVSAFSQKKRGIPLVVLGRYSPEENAYHKEVLESASDEVAFVGDVHDQEVVKALKYHASLYFHGDQVGEANLSLIEAMSCGSPVMAHNNLFNSWVTGKGAVYFKDAAECDQKLSQLLEDNKQKLQAMRKSNLDRYHEEFANDKDLKAYEELFLSLIPLR